MPTLSMNAIVDQLVTDLQFIQNFQHGLNRVNDQVLRDLAAVHDSVHVAVEQLKEMTQQTGNESGFLPPGVSSGKINHCANFGPNSQQNGNGHVEAPKVPEEYVNQYWPMEHGQHVAVSDFPVLKVMVVGGCFAEVTSRYLPRLAPARGFKIETTHDWIDNARDIEDDILILQLGTAKILEHTLDVSQTAEVRRNGLAAAKQMVSLYIDKWAAVIPSTTLMMVQGLSGPYTSPYGRMEWKQGFDALMGMHIQDLNRHMVDCILKYPNAIYINEEELMSAAGKNMTIDDQVAPFFHHAPIELVCGVAADEVERQKYFKYPGDYYAVRLLCMEYIDCYQIWKGKGLIKCVVMDLDNTMWPGVAGEPDWINVKETDGWQTMKFGFFGGIHEAVGLLKQRGIVLATCSKGNEATSLRCWEEMYSHCKGDGMNHVLGPQDFVLQKINWNRKSQNIQEIAKALNIGLDSILFIDDNPTERHEVMNQLPMVKILGENMVTLRHVLLRHPLLQTFSATAEAANRSEMMKGQVLREQERFQHQTEEEFLASMHIKLDVQIATGDDLDRVAELFSRTNQFRTTGIQPNRKEIEEKYAGDGRMVFVLRVWDRFAAYGVVGAALMNRGNIDNLAISCRVIGLSLAAPFVTSMYEYVADEFVPFTAHIVPTERNIPCRSVFSEAGFKRCEPPPGQADNEGGWWLCPSRSELKPVNIITHNVTVTRKMVPVDNFIPGSIVDGQVKFSECFQSLDTSTEIPVIYEFSAVPRAGVCPKFMTPAECEYVMKFIEKVEAKKDPNVPDGVGNHAEADISVLSDYVLNAIKCRAARLVRFLPSKIRRNGQANGLSGVVGPRVDPCEIRSIKLMTIDPKDNQDGPHYDGCEMTLTVFLTDTSDCTCGKRVGTAGSMIMPILGLAQGPVAGDCIMLENYDGEGTGVRNEKSLYYITVPCCGKPAWYMKIHF